MGNQLPREALQPPSPRRPLRGSAYLPRHPLHHQAGGQEREMLTKIEIKVKKKTVSSIIFLWSCFLVGRKYLLSCQNKINPIKPDVGQK